MHQESQSSHLALLLAAPHPGEAAMLRDQAAMAQALTDRSFAQDQIVLLPAGEYDSQPARLDRPRVLAALQDVSQAAAVWTQGTVFVHVSGHGFFAGDTVETARPGLLFADSVDENDDSHLFWDDFFAALAVPAGVRLTLLPDL